jgi:glycosyltransferase involved in cell wall biosynthesis
MRIYWYWPFARPEELPLAGATARVGDEITVHVIDREAAPPASPCARVLLCRDLPDVRRDLGPAPVWLASRAVTYTERARQREAALVSIRPDICHLHYLNRFTDWVLPRQRGFHLVMSVHDVVPHESRLPPRAERALLRATYRRADALIVHHDRLRRDLLTTFNVDPRRVHVVPHQVFAYDAAPPVALPERPCVLFFGALRPNKGIGVFLDAIGTLSEEIVVNVAGRGESRIEEQLLRAAASDPRLHVEIDHVPISRKVELFRQASVVVLPYTSFASQSGVLHDAYAQGRPVIVTDVGALGETVREDGTGIVVPPGDAAALARAIELLLSDTPRLAHHADEALAVRQARSPGKLGPLLRLVYDAAAGS